MCPEPVGWDGLTEEFRAGRGGPQETAVLWLPQSPLEAPVVTGHGKMLLHLHLSSFCWNSNLVSFSSSVP